MGRCEAFSRAFHRGTKETRGRDGGVKEGVCFVDLCQGEPKVALQHHQTGHESPGLWHWMLVRTDKADRRDVSGRKRRGTQRLGQCKLVQIRALRLLSPLFFSLEVPERKKMGGRGERIGSLKRKRSQSTEKRGSYPCSGSTLSHSAPLLPLVHRFYTALTNDSAVYTIYNLSPWRKGSFSHSVCQAV